MCTQPLSEIRLPIVVYRPTTFLSYAHSGLAFALPPFVYGVVFPRHVFTGTDFVTWVPETAEEKIRPDVRLLQARRRHPMVSTPAGSKPYRSARS